MDHVLGSHTPNTGRTVWNANDDLLETNLDSLSADLDAEASARAAADTTLSGNITTVQGNLDAHKTSDDHDSRYLSTGYLSSIVRTLTDQLVDGIKTFVKDIIIKKETAAILFKNSSDRPIGSLISGVDANNMSRIGISTYSPDGSQVRTLAVIADDDAVGVQFPFSDVYAKFKKLATEEYVQSRVRSGSAYLSGQTANLSNGDSGYAVVGSLEQIFSIPPGMRITRINAAASGGIIKTADIACNVSAQAVKVYVITTTNLATFEIRDVSGTTLFSGTGAKQISGTIAVTLTVSV